MGNQTSKIIEKTRERRTSKARRRSTTTLGARSATMSHASSQGNYDWVACGQNNTTTTTTTSSSSGGETITTMSTSTTGSGSGAIESAMAAAAHKAVSSSTSNQGGFDRPEIPRRKSISEVLNKRRGSFSRQAVSQDDLREYDRFQRQHYLLKSARKTNSDVPITQPATILDLGTANGIWALEMAALYPASTVIGMDIKPPSMQQASGLKNLKYIQANINESFPLADASVDYIFQRDMGQVIRKEKWTHVLQEMARVLKPGGYIELVEADLWHHNPGPVQQAFDAFMQEQCQEFGLDFCFTESLGQTITAAGFDELDHQALDIPIGEWPRDADLKQFGFINKETQKAYLRNRKSFFTSTWGISSDDYDQAVLEVLEEFEDYHGFTRFNCWIAKKPQL